MLNSGKRGIAVFDVEGVLIPKNRYLLFEVGRNLRFSQFVKIVFYGILYELNLISLKSALNKIFRVFKGFKVKELLQVFRVIPLMADAEEVFGKLGCEGWKTVLISSGLPSFVVEDLALRLKADYAFGFDLQTEDGVVTGKVSGETIEENGKLQVLKKVLEMEGLGPEKCVVIADDRNNAPMMLPGMLKIGFNPDFVIRIKADHVVTGGLIETLPLIEGEAPKRRVWPSKNAVFREIIHGCGFTVPILSSLLGRSAVALLILVVTFLYCASELTMMEGKKFPIVSFIIRHAATHGELYEFAFAPIFFAFGILLTLLLFPAPASSAAIAIFTLGDSTAAISGRIVGKRTLPFNKGKTLEGSIIGLFIGFLVATFFVDPVKALASATAAMLVESLPLPLSDNLTVPLTAGVTMTLML
jgi:phosphoserine phosphatase/dolichol kinase